MIFKNFLDEDYEYPRHIRDRYLDEDDRYYRRRYLFEGKEEFANKLKGLFDTNDYSGFDPDKCSKNNTYWCSLKDENGKTAINMEIDNVKQEVKCEVNQSVFRTFPATLKKICGDYEYKLTYKYGIKAEIAKWCNNAKRECFDSIIEFIEHNRNYVHEPFDLDLKRQNGKVYAKIVLRGKEREVKEFEELFKIFTKYNFKIDYVYALPYDGYRNILGDVEDELEDELEDLLDEIKGTNSNNENDQIFLPYIDKMCSIIKEVANNYANAMKISGRLMTIVKSKSSSRINNDIIDDTIRSFIEVFRYNDIYIIFDMIENFYDEADVANADDKIGELLKHAEDKISEIITNAFPNIDAKRVIRKFFKM